MYIYHNPCTTLAFPYLKISPFGKSTLILSKTLSDFHVSITELVSTCLNLSKLVWNWFSLLFQSIDDEPPMSFYGVYDGHAGKDAAAFAASHLHGKIFFNFSYSHFKIRRAKKIWGTREKSSLFPYKRTAFFSGTPNFFVPSYFEAALVINRCKKIGI